jgi:hypothetical protein
MKLSHVNSREARQWGNVALLGLRKTLSLGIFGYTPDDGYMKKMLRTVTVL